MGELVSIRGMVLNAKPRFVLLAQKVSEQRWRYKNYYGWEDVRPEFYDRATNLLISLLIELDNFLIITEENSDGISRYAQFSPQDLTTFILQYDTLNRGAYITKAMFDVDDFLTSVARKIGIEPCRNWYVPLVQEYVRVIGLTDRQYKILIAPALYRNASHNNGYHKKGEDFDLTVKGATFHFKKDEPVSGFNWVNIQIIFNELFGVIDAIINSEKVKAEPFIPHTSQTYPM